MLRFAKTLGALTLMGLGLQSACGFSLLGPFNQGWQVPTIGYQLGGDIGGPHNLGEEYRWNTPTNYYAFDQNFLDFFGSNGVWAVEQAFAVFNALSNVSAYSAELTEVPLETRRINYRAQALHLLDLKTVTAALILEELGLAESDRYIWTLRTREPQPPQPCPWMIYGVIRWSFDPVNWQPSSYINGALYSYIIVEDCSDTPPPSGVTFPFPVDPLAVEHLPASSLGSGFGYGYYTTRLTRDDIGGLRYLYRTNNVNWEPISNDSTLFYTNIAAGQQLLFTSNLTTLSWEALTNPVFGGDIVATTTNIYTNIYITNITAYFTNYPFDPLGTPPHLEFSTNLTLTVQTYYHRTFKNVFTPVFTNGAWTFEPLVDISFHTNLSLITVETTSVTNQPFTPVGTPPITNTTSVTYLTNTIAGEYFILPTNLCDISLVDLQATLVNFNTNVVVSATNAPAGFTNDQSFTQIVIDYFTNHVFTYYNVECPGTNTTLRQGMDKFTFLRANYDSLVGRFFQPITNVYSLVEVTNSQPVKRWFRRVVTSPDFLITAGDFPAGGILGSRGVTFNYDEDIANPGLAGPGNIEPNMSITFNKTVPLLRNVYGTNFLQDGLSERAATTNVIWGSFDGSTNAPVLYPDGSSIMDLEAQILFQIITAALPDGQVGVAYPPTQLEAAGGVLPYGPWSWAGGWPSLPPGLSLSPTGLISGTPTGAGTYGFAVSVTGGDARTITRSLSINVSP